jgi:energy-coupling factor transporter ATP-binding protein EcfA2
LARIGKIRIVNFTYNDNRHIYDQTLDFYNGEDVLLNLQNGGGKTVLVQMMMQPIIPNQKLKDRLLKDYFEHAKAPAYIMIEWILDHSSKRLVTGIGIKKIQMKQVEDENHSIKIVTFLSEYEGISDYSIQNMALTTEAKGVVRLIEFEKVIKNLSEAEKQGNSVKVFRWNAASDKREYANRLSEYQINPSEWKNLMIKINEEEAGLTSFFNDCKSNQALIKKWFIPTIEDQLNKNGNLIKSIRELIRNHTSQLVKNEALILEREVFLDFKTKSHGVIAALEEYKDLIAALEKNKDDLGSAFLFVQDSFQQLLKVKTEVDSSIKQTEHEITNLEYQQLSFRYLTIAQTQAQLEQEISRITDEMTKLGEADTQMKQQKKILVCAKLSAEIINLNVRIAKFEVELEKENLQQADRNSIIDDLCYTLKQKYQTKIRHVEEELAQLSQNVSKQEKKLVEYQNEIRTSKGESVFLQEQLIQIRGQLSGFLAMERELSFIYPQYLQIDMTNSLRYSEEHFTKWQEQLKAEEHELNQESARLIKNRNESEAQLADVEQQLKLLRDSYPDLLVEKRNKETEQLNYHHQKQQLLKILAKYSLDEDYLFTKEKAIHFLQSEREQFQKALNEHIYEKSILKKRLEKYKAGKALELPEELKQLFETNNIFVELGHEWLRNLSEQKKEKQRIVKNNPFLPYAMIVSKQDFELIQNLDFQGIISPIIPILEREKLEQVYFKQIKNQVYAVHELSFLIPFDDKVLNKNYVKELIAKITAQIAEKDQMITQLDEALSHSSADLLKLQDFSYTLPKVQMQEQELESLCMKIEKHTKQLADQEKMMTSLKVTVDQTAVAQNELRYKKDHFERKKEELIGFWPKCKQYQTDLQAQRTLEEKLVQTAELLAKYEQKMDALKDNMNAGMQEKNSMTVALERMHLQYTKYEKTAKRLPNDPLFENSIEQLESKLAAYRSQSSGKVQSLLDILEDYRQQRVEKQKAVTKNQIAESLYLDKEYHDFEYEECLKIINQIHDNINQKEAAKRSLQLQEAEIKSDLKHVLQNIIDHCGYTRPLSREQIQEIDFEKVIQFKKFDQKNLEKKRSNCQTQENKLNQLKYVLTEYQEFADSEAEQSQLADNIQIRMKEDGYQEFDPWIGSLMKQQKEFDLALQDGKNVIAAQLRKIEREFISRSELFRNLFRVILPEEKRDQPTHALHAFSRVFLQIERKLGQLAIDMKKIDDMEQSIIENTLGYLKNVYDEMDHIDRNSTIELAGRRCKMLIISLPEKETLDRLSLAEYLKYTISNCVDLHKSGNSIEKILDSEINTYNLFDRYVSINKIEIHLMKIEPNKLKKKTWRQVIGENSGGELFVSAFVVFISLLTYMRGDNVLNMSGKSKVLIMDNPFGPITSEHLLKPLFEISKKYHTQMICLTDVKGYAIYDRFDLIYSLNIEREVGRDDEYIEIKTLKKDITMAEDEVLSASMFKLDDISRFEQVN